MAEQGRAKLGVPYLPCTMIKDEYLFDIIYCNYIYFLKKKLVFCWELCQYSISHQNSNSTILLLFSKCCKIEKKYLTYNHRKDNSFLLRSLKIYWFKYVFIFLMQLLLINNFRAAEDS